MVNTKISTNGEEETELTHLPALVRGFIVKNPIDTLNAMIEYGILDNLGYMLVKIDGDS